MTHGATVRVTFVKAPRKLMATPVWAIDTTVADSQAAWALTCTAWPTVRVGRGGVGVRGSTVMTGLLKGARSPGMAVWPCPVVRGCARPGYGQVVQGLGATKSSV